MAAEDEGLHIGRLAVLGAGKMGETLISALLESGVLTAEQIIATAKHPQRLEKLAERFAVATTLDNCEAVAGADLVLLCVKPQVAPVVLEEVSSVLRPSQLLVSIVAGLTTGAIEGRLPPEVPVARAMPNTPSRLGCGMTAVCGGRAALPEHLELSRSLFSRLGRALVLDEKHFDAVTGLSASGPAFIYIVIEALAEGGVKVGLPRQVATELAAQTCLGAAHMVLETGQHPAQLKDEVTTPAGCTIDGILKLEEGGLRVTLIKAIVEAAGRARQLVDG
jgi:pyrroline-5-carboxylate reductase